MRTRTDKRFSFSLLALATFLTGLIVSTAQANTIVYSITSIPNANSVVYADNLSPALTDTLSGTITVSSTQSIFGTWNSGNLPSSAITLSYNLSMSNASVSENNITGSQDLGTLITNNDIQGGGLTLTASGIFMPNPNVSGGQVELEDDGPPFPTVPYPVVSLTWNGNAFLWAEPSNFAGANIEILATPGTPPTVGSVYGNGATWQIAAVVSEPATLTLLGSALLLLGGTYLLQRRRPASCSSCR
jgi:hypothetical protein